METIQAINNMANAEASGVDSARTPGGAALHKKAGNIHLAVANAVIIASANGLQPDTDLATQTRLAAAVDRQIAKQSTGAPDASSITRHILNDFYLQEAAAARLTMAGERDPLAHVADRDSNRRMDQTLDILERNNIRADVILKTASKEDMSAIASGSFDKIESEHTRFAVGTILRHSEAQMSTPTASLPVQPRAAAEAKPYPAHGIGSDARMNMIRPVNFGKRVSMER